MDNLLNNNNFDLEGLTEQEKAEALKILQEYADNGDSETLKEMLVSDYDEFPVDIATFLHDRNYLGNALYDGEGRFTLYPYWEEKLKEIFPTSTTTAYNTIILTGCLAGDTLIPLLSGEKVKIADLAARNRLDDYVYSYDVETNQYVPGHLVNAFSTGIKPVYEITLDNGEKIRATSNHKFLTRDKHWKSIDSGLAIGDSLMPFNRRYDAPTSDEISDDYEIKVSDIQFIANEQVYDLTIDEYHNFVIDSGIVAHNSIGIGKTLVSVVCMLYMLYRLLCLKDPYLYYGLQPIDKITIAFVNISLEASKGVGLDKFNQMILASPWFMSHGKMAGITNLEYRPEKHIEVVAASSNNQIIGRALFCLDGEVKIETSEGVMALKDLVNKEIQVYSLDKNGDKILSDKCTVQPTVISNEEYELELEDGTVIHCTPNHRFLLKDGTYKEAQYLTEDDELEDSIY